MKKTVRPPTHCSCCVQRKSNPPSLSHYHSITPEKENYISRIDANVQHTHNAIIKYLNYRAALNRKRNTFVPAVNLPPEVLATIFEFACCPDRGDCTIVNIDWSEAPVVTPLFIGSICSAWRSIAWGAPQLWNSIALIYHDTIDKKLAEMLDYWLSKSGELPLTVKLFEDEYHDTTGESDMVINVIEEYADRLHTLELFLPWSWKYELKYIATYGPLLTRLTLRTFADADSDNPTMKLDNMFANAVQLREVKLDGYIEWYSTLDVSLPWAQLESLESGYDDISELVRILCLCPRLRRFSVWLKNKQPWTVFPSIMTRHAGLEALEVFGYSEILHPEFFRMLELPALHSFVLHLDSTPHQWALWLPPFLSHVAQTLETLHLPYVAPLEEELLIILPLVPKLRNLVLLNPRADGLEERFTQRALDLMNPTKYEGLEGQGIGQLDSQGSVDGAGTTGPDEKGNGHCLVPHLETFEFQGQIAFTPHALVEFLVARWRGRSAPSHSVGFESPYKKLEGPTMQTAFNPLPPNLYVSSPRLRSVILHVPMHCFEFEETDAAVVQELRMEGMHLKLIKSLYLGASCTALGLSCWGSEHVGR